MNSAGPELPLEIWVRIAEFDAEVLARLLFVVPGLAGFARSHNLAERVLARNAERVYGLAKEGIYISHMVGALKHGPELKRRFYRTCSLRTCYMGKLHGTVKPVASSYWYEDPDKITTGSAVEEWDHGRCLWKDYGHGRHTPAGVFTEDLGFLPVGSRCVRDGMALEVVRKGDIAVFRTRHGRFMVDDAECWVNERESGIRAPYYTVVFLSDAVCISIATHFWNKIEFLVASVQRYGDCIRVNGRGGELFIRRGHDIVCRSDRRLLRVKKRGDEWEVASVDGPYFCYHRVRGDKKIETMVRDDRLMRHATRTHEYRNDWGSRLVIDEPDFRAIIERHKHTIEDVVAIRGRLRGIATVHTRVGRFVTKLPQRSTSAYPMSAWRAAFINGRPAHKGAVWRCIWKSAYYLGRFEEVTAQDWDGFHAADGLDSSD